MQLVPLRRRRRERARHRPAHGGFRIASIAAIAVLAGSALESASAQDSTERRIDVMIVDSVTRLPIKRARLTSSARPTEIALADSTGRATLRVHGQDSLTIDANADGYRPRSRRLVLRGLDFLSVDLALAPTITVLGERTITASGGVSATSDMGRLTDFERRLRMGKGRYIVRSDIERRGAVQTTDLFRGMAGLRVADSGYAKLVVATRSAQLSLVSKSAHKECVVPVAVDGVLREGSFQVDALDPKELHGIEVYIGVGTIPPEFSSMRQNAWCGLIVIWTRAR